MEVSTRRLGEIDEDDGAEEEAEDHDRDGIEKEVPSAKSVEERKSRTGDDEVDGGDDEGRSDGVLETGEGEQGGRVVHEGVESRQLLSRLEECRQESRSSELRDDEDILVL